MNKEQLISEVLLLPASAIDYYISKNLAALFPDKALIEGEGGYFNVEGYADAQLCTLTRKTFTYNQVTTHWIAPEREVLHWQYGGMSLDFVNGVADPMDQEPAPANNRQETLDRVKKAWLEVLWQGHSLDILLLLLESSHYSSMQHWILADSQEIARGFFSAVCQWCNLRQPDPTQQSQARDSRRPESVLYITSALRRARCSLETRHSLCRSRWQRQDSRSESAYQHTGATLSLCKKFSCSPYPGCRRSQHSPSVRPGTPGCSLRFSA